MRARVFDMDGTSMPEWGVVDAAVARRAFEAAPLVENIREVLADVHARGEHACLITMSPKYFADHFLDFGFDAIYATPFPADGTTTLDETGVLEPEDKPRKAAEFCAERGLDLAEAVAYGDSMSDVPLFAEVGFRIAVNGDHHLAERSDLAVTGSDLMAAYRAARTLIDR